MKESRWVCSKCWAKLELRELNYWEDKDARRKIKKSVAIMSMESIHQK